MRTPFDGFFDDAALFPPGNARLPDAVAAHLARRRTPLGHLIGPFVCPASRLTELAAAVSAERDVLTATRRVFSSERHSQLEVAVVAEEQFAVPQGLRVVSVETRNPRLTVPCGARLIVEIGSEQRALPHAVVLKLRTGGPDASFFPTPDALGTALGRLVRSRRPFKLTAGLHRAVRHIDPADGIVHHGFANVLLAVDALRSGADDTAATAILARTDDGVGHDLARLDAARIVAVRSLFTSFGTCSIDEPAADLASLGLLTEKMAS